MSDFIKNLIKATESELNSRREKDMNTVFKSLLPIIKELDSLQILGVKFYDGTLFRYSIFTEGSRKGNIEILTPEPCLIYAHETDSTAPFALSRFQNEPLPSKLHGPEYVLYGNSSGSQVESGNQGLPPNAISSPRKGLTPFLRSVER
jgi:hypothetical protein